MGLGLTMLNKSSGDGFWSRLDEYRLSTSGNPHDRMAATQFRMQREMAVAQFAAVELAQESLAVARYTNAVMQSVDHTLKEVFTAVTETNAQLDGIHKTQLEHLEIVKRERALKEVLFQLGNLLDTVQATNDAASAIVTAKMLLAELDRYKLSTADLSDFNDKRTFDSLTTRAKTILREAPHELIEEVSDFEVSYLLYVGRNEKGFIAPDLPGPHASPKWKPAKKPQLQELVPPKKPAPLVIRPRPDQVGSAKGFFGGDKALAPDPGPPPSAPSANQLPDGYVPPTIENIPTEESTNARLKATTWFTMTPVDHARAYERELREWKEKTEKHLHEMAKWSKEKELAEQEHANKTAEWEKAMQEHEQRVAHAQQRLQEELAEHEAAEEKRREEHAEKCRVIADQNAERERQVMAAGRRYEAMMEEYRTAIHSYLEQYPGLQTFYARLPAANVFYPAAVPAAETTPGAAGSDAERCKALRGFVEECEVFEVEVIGCPFCSAQVRVKNLISHCNKQHANEQLLLDEKELTDLVFKVVKEVR
jgi:hypothetical protein